jgi:hypothetical protein
MGGGLLLGGGRWLCSPLKSKRTLAEQLEEEEDLAGEEQEDVPPPFI